MVNTIKKLLVAEIKEFLSPLNWLVIALGLLLGSEYWSITLITTFSMFFNIYFIFKIEIVILSVCCFILIFGWNLVSQFFSDHRFILVKWYVLYVGVLVIYKTIWPSEAVNLCTTNSFFFNNDFFNQELLETGYAAEKNLRNFFMMDSYTTILRQWAIICSALTFAVIPNRYMQKHFTWDTGLLILLITSFLTLIITSNNFFTFYVLLEGVNLALIALIALRRYNIWSLEAALKYFVLNGLINGLLLLSLVLMYYQTNSLNFIDIKYYLTSTSNYNWAVILFILAFFFKLSAWPLHTWTPDVYEGSATWVLFYMALVIKSILFALFIRFNFFIFLPILTMLKPLLYISGIGSVIIGTFGSLWQKSLKRFLAYSTITNTGLCLLTLIAYNSINFFNVGVVIFHLFFYFLTTFLTFSFYFQLIKTDSKRLYFFSDYFSLKNQKGIKIKLFIFLFLNAIVMMAALPPAITFYSKFMLLYCLMQQKYYFTTLIILLLNCLMCYYYLRIIKIFYFEDPKTDIYQVILFNSTDASNTYIETTTYKTQMYLIISFIMFFQWVLTFVIDKLICVFIKYGTYSFIVL